MRELGLELLDSGRNIFLARGSLNANLGQFLNDANVEVELGGSRAGAALLALFALLSASADKVALFFGILLRDASALQARLVDSALSGSSKLACRSGLLGWESGWVKVTDQAFGSNDLVTVSRCAGLFETLAGSLLALACNILELLLTPLLKANLASLGLVRLVCAQLLEVCILEILSCLVLLLLLSARLVRLLTKRSQVLEGLVLLGLESIQLSLELGVLVAQGLVLGVVQELLLLSDLGLDVVNLLLLSVEARKVLAGLVKGADLGEGLLLINQLHHATVDLLLQTCDFLVNLLDRLVVRLSLCSLEFGQLLLKLVVELLDLLENGIAARLVPLLCLADSVELGLELLLTFGIGRVLVVRLCIVELSLAGVLAMVSTGCQTLISACDAGTRRPINTRSTYQLLLSHSVLLLKFGKFLLVLLLVRLVRLDDLLLALRGRAIGGGLLGGGGSCNVGHVCYAVNWVDELTDGVRR